MFPLSANIVGDWIMIGDYSEAKSKKLSFKDIKKLYKVPVMPYIKFSVEKYLKIKDTVDMVSGAMLTYNFGMIGESDALSGAFSYGSYKFSALSIEVFLGFGFGRPK